MTDANSNVNSMPAGWEGAKEAQSNWFKFVVVGDHIKGTLLSRELRESTDPQFPDQWVYKLRKEDGSVHYVGISVKKVGTVERLNNYPVGTIIGILYERDGEQTPEQKKKKLAPAKYLKVVDFGTDPEYKGFEDSNEAAQQAAEEDM